MFCCFLFLSFNSFLSIFQETLIYRVICQVLPVLFVIKGYFYLEARGSGIEIYLFNYVSLTNKILIRFFNPILVWPSAAATDEQVRKVRGGEHSRVVSMYFLIWCVPFHSPMSLRIRTRSSAHPSTHSSTHWSTHSSAHWSTHSSAHWSTHSSAHWCTYSSAHWSTHPATQPGPSMWEGESQVRPAESTNRASDGRGL